MEVTLLGVSALALIFASVKLLKKQGMPEHIAL